MRQRHFLVAAGACLAALALMAPSAFADPPVHKLLAGAGSVTTEKVMNDFAGIIPTLGNYDGSTVPPGTITTKNPIAGSDCTFARPVGSGAGVQRLVDERNAAAAANRRPCLDFARSSDNNSANFPNSGLTYVPFAVDGVTIVTRNDSPLTTNFTNTAPVNFLKQLYECTLPDAVQSQYRPLIPQAGSGTRSFFLSKIGATLNLARAEGGMCDKVGAPSQLDTTGPTPVPLVENNGSKLNDPRNVVPYSIADYKAQSSGAVTDISGNTKMRRVNGIIPDLANRSFPLLRAVYNVIPKQFSNNNNADGSGIGSDPDYGPVFVGRGSTICSRTDVIFGKGFEPLTPGDSLLPAGNTGCGDVISIMVPGGPTTVRPSP